MSLPMEMTKINRASFILRPFCDFFFYKLNGFGLKWATLCLNNCVEEAWFSRLFADCIIFWDGRRGREAKETGLATLSVEHLSSNLNTTTATAVWGYMAQDLIAPFTRKKSDDACWKIQTAIKLGELVSMYSCFNLISPSHVHSSHVLFARM